MIEDLKYYITVEDDCLTLPFKLNVDDTKKHIEDIAEYIRKYTDYGTSKEFHYVDYGIYMLVIFERNCRLVRLVDYDINHYTFYDVTDVAEFKSSIADLLTVTKDPTQFKLWLI